MQISLLGMVFVVFLVLKLIGVILWSWWWVTAPLWGPFLFFFCLIMIFGGRVTKRKNYGFGSKHRSW